MPSKSRREAYVTAGRCRSCGRPKEAEHTRCQKCLDGKKKYRQHLHDQGRCIKCGLFLVMEEATKKCRNCAEETFSFKW